MRIGILTPIYEPATGGAASYYSMISREFLKNKSITEVTIITEKHYLSPNRETLLNGSCDVIRIFPFRSGRQENIFKKYLQYFYQNILYFKLPSIIADCRVDILIVHSSFYNFPNILNPIITLISKTTIVIADVRDCLLKKKDLNSLIIYNSIIACSENVDRHLSQYIPIYNLTELIPIPQEKFIIKQSHANLRILKKYNLKKSSYILYAGLLKSGKNINYLLETYIQYCKLESSPLPLVLAGIPKNKNLAKLAKNINGVSILGEIKRVDLLKIIKFAALNVNLSLSEGMPRISLEALALNTKTILPQGIPEFDKYCKKWVAISYSSSSKLALQFQRVLLSNDLPKYPVSNHSINNVIKKYYKIFTKFKRDDGYAKK